MTMRVLHVDTGTEWRGGQRQLFLLARGLRELGYEPLVIAPPASPLAERLRERGMAVSTTPMRGAWDLAAVHQIRKLMRTWAPDVVHAHDSRAHALLLSALEGDFATSLVITRRTTAHPTPRGLQLGHRVARYVAISRAVRRELIAGGIDPVLVDVVPPGIDVPDAVAARVWRDECGWPADTVICGVVGRLDSDDGRELLARIAVALPSPARERARLVVFGGGSEGGTTIGGVAAYEAGTAEGGPALMAGLDLLWHLSSPHGLGTAALDAMALGVPPIAFAVGALPEFIEHERSGIVVERGGVDAFAAEAARLILDERARRILAAGGPARASRFEARQMVKSHDRVYRSLTPASSSSSAPETS